MTPERAADLALRWTRLYTSELPTPTAERRLEEIASDLHDHIALERSRGATDPRIALSILSRTARGVVADVTWRREIRSVKGETVNLRTSLVPALFVLLGIAAMVVGEADDAPGLVMFGILIIGVAIAFAARPSLRSRSRVLGLVLGAIALTAVAAGVAGWLENAL